MTTAHATIAGNVPGLGDNSVLTDAPVKAAVVSAAFPRRARLRNPQQFQDTFSQGRRINGVLFRLHVRFPSEQCDSELHDSAARHADDATPDAARLGIAVSKRVDPKAVGRNRIKRVSRESFRSARARLPKADYVLLAQREAARADNAQLAQALDVLWTRAAALDAAALKRGPAAVTMPPGDLSADKPGCTPELP